MPNRKKDKRRYWGGTVSYHGSNRKKYNWSTQKQRVQNSILNSLGHYPEEKRDAIKRISESND